MILGLAVLLQYTPVTDDDRQHRMTIVELCNATATFGQKTEANYNQVESTIIIFLFLFKI